MRIKAFSFSLQKCVIPHNAHLYPRFNAISCWMGLSHTFLQQRAHPSLIWQKCIMTPLTHSKTSFLARLQCGNEDQGEIHPFPFPGNRSFLRGLEAFSAFLRYGSAKLYYRAPLKPETSWRIFSGAMILEQILWGLKNISVFCSDPSSFNSCKKAVGEQQLC